MAAGQRIKGQEVSILITVDGEVQSEITDLQNFGITPQTELIQQGYLGETTDRYDEIFKGAKGDFEMHTHSQDFVTLEKAIIDRARRKTPDVVFNIVATLAFPNGDTPTITLPDVKWGPMANTVPNRADYLKIKMEFGCAEPDFETS
jgi:hypothetical protein